MIFLFFILLTHSYMYVHPWLREGGMPGGLQKLKK